MDKKKLKKTKKRVLISIITIAVIILVLIFINTNSVQGIKDIFKEPEKIVIEDRCSLVMGNVFHEIKNSGECEISCKNNCELRGKKFVESEFIKSQDSCHTCNCYCK